MGFISFLKGVGNKVLGGVHSAGRFLGQHIAPVVSRIASIVQKVAPYASGVAGALGQPELAGPISAVSRVAGKIKGYADKLSQSRMGGGSG